MSTRPSSWFAIAEHPLAVVISMMTLAAMLGAFVIWVISFFVFKTDYNRDLAWHDVQHQTMRKERLQDEVDRLGTRKLIQGGKLDLQESAELDLWQKKLDTANAKLEKLADQAKEVSKTK
jgi:hypothetical protein